MLKNSHVVFHARFLLFFAGFFAAGVEPEPSPSPSSDNLIAPSSSLMELWRCFFDGVSCLDNSVEDAGGSSCGLVIIKDELEFID
jgi:hypothetical protein